MSHRWLTAFAIVGMTTLLVGPGVAQTSGSGTAPGSAPGASTPGTTTGTQPPPSPSQPGSPLPSVGTPAGKAMPGTAQPGTAQPGTGQMGSGSTGPGSKKSAAPNGQASSDQVKNLQQALQVKGLDPGPVDGMMGPKTQAALRAYQKDQNLPQTGRTDAQTLEKLGIPR